VGNDIPKNVRPARPQLIPIPVASANGLWDLTTPIEAPVPAPRTATRQLIPVGSNTTYQRQESSEPRKAANRGRMEDEMVLPSDHLWSCLQYLIEQPLSILILDIELNLKFPEG
jgi:hypothetical protein